MVDKIREEFDDEIRKKFFKSHPFCQYCGKPTIHIHHLIPIVQGGDNRESNLIPLCAECHGLIHNQHFSNDWKEAQRIGIEKAKAEGKYKGRQIKKIEKKIYFSLKRQYNDKKITKTEFAELLRISRPTLNKVLNNEEEYVKAMI